MDINTDRIDLEAIREDFESLSQDEREIVYYVIQGIKLAADIPSGKSA